MSTKQNDAKKVRSNNILQPQPLPTENKMLNNGFTEADSADTKALNYHGTVCARGTATDGAINMPEGVKGVVLRESQIPNPLPENPDDLPEALKTYLRTGVVGEFTDPDNNPFNYRFIRDDPTDNQNHDLPNCVDPHSVEGRKNNYLCLWLQFGGTWAPELPYQFSVIGSNTNECGQS